MNQHILYDLASPAVLICPSALVQTTECLVVTVTDSASLASETRVRAHCTPDSRYTRIALHLGH